MPPLLCYNELPAAAFPGKPLNAGAGMEDAPSLLNVPISPATGSGCCAGDGWRRGGTCLGWEAAQLALLSATARCHPLKRVFSQSSSAGISRLLPRSRLQPVGSPRLSLLQHEHERAGESWSSQMSPLKNPAKRVEIPRPGLKQGGQARQWDEFWFDPD